MRRRKRIAVMHAFTRLLSLVLCAALSLSMLPARSLSVGESSRLCGHICGDGTCGYAAGEEGTPCDHICRIAGFDGYTPGTPLITYTAPYGAACADVLAALPATLPGRLACAEGAFDIPVTWNCGAFAGESGVYTFRAALTDTHCAYAVPDDPATTGIDESADSPYCDLPGAEVTVLPSADPVEPPVVPARGHVCEVTGFTDFDPSTVLAIAQFDKGRTAEELYDEVLPKSLNVTYACSCADTVTVLPEGSPDAQPVLTTAPLPVTWECADFDPGKTGDYIFTVKALPAYPFTYLKRDDPATVDVDESLLPSILVRVYEPTSPTAGFTVCYGVLNSDRVHVRSGPGTIFESLAQFDTDTPVIVTGQCDHWYRVNIATWTGAFIDQSLITILEEQTEAAAPVTGRLNADEVKIRKGPDREYDVITVLPEGAPMTVLGRCGNWYYISTEDIEQGYVWREYVTIDPPVPAEGPACTCAEHCTEGHINAECPVCAAHPDDCAVRYIAEGYPRTGRVNTENCEVRVGEATLHLHQDAVLTLYSEADGLYEFSSDEITKGFIATESVTVIEYKCTCTVPCTETACNQLCPVCAAEGWGACAVKELSEQTISAVAEDGSTITISGILPAGATASVTVVPLEAAAEFVAEGAEILFAYDIKILVAGVEWQPDEHVRVSITPPPEKPIVTDVAVTHVAEDKGTGEVTTSTITDVSTTLADETAAQPGAVEFAAEGFSVYVITLGTTTPRVTFSYDSSLTVQYSTDNSTYTTLNGDVTVAPGTTLYFKVTNGTVNSVIRDGATILTSNGSNVYTVDNVTVNTTIVIGSNISLDVSKGPIVIGGANGSNRVYNYYDDNGAQTGPHLSSNIYTITGSTGNDENGGEYNVTLTGAGDFNVVLDGVGIYTGKPGGVNTSEGICAPVSTSGVTGDGNINITLVGINTLKNVSYNPGDSYAALEKNNTPSTLILGGDGTLYATGGADSTGIGSSNNLSNGSGGTNNIIINSGTIFATSTESGGAGIGSGDNKPAHNIKIYGGYITATGVGNGAGIGGSGSANFIGGSGEVYIYGGTITATSNGTGAGIGGGGSGSGEGALGGNGTIHIYGGDITASSIGGGNGGGGNGGTATVNISGGKVSTTGSIGGGDSTSGSGGEATIEITGGTISATSISGGHGAGGAHAGGTLAVTGGSAKVTHVCPVITPTNGSTRVWPYTVYVANAGNPVSNAEVTAVTIVPSLGYSYGLNNVYTDSYGRIYLWLPANEQVTSVTVMINGEPTPCDTTNVQAAASITSDPAITGGYVEFGQTLTANLSHGTASAWRWEKHSGSTWSVISSATGSTFTPSVHDIGEIRVVINGDYTSPSVFISAPQLSVTVPTTMVVTVNGAGQCTAAGGAIANNSAVPVYVTNVSYAWVTDSAGNDADELFHDYTLVNAALRLGETAYNFVGATPAPVSPNATIAAKNGGTAGSLALHWEFTLGTGNYLKLVPALGSPVHVATVTYTIDYKLSTP